MIYGFPSETTCICILGEDQIMHHWNFLKGFCCLSLVQNANLYKLAQESQCSVHLRLPVNSTSDFLHLPTFSQCLCLSSWTVWLVTGSLISCHRQWVEFDWSNYRKPHTFIDYARCIHLLQMGSIVKPVEVMSTVKVRTRDGFLSTPNLKPVAIYSSISQTPKVFRCKWSVPKL